MAATIRIVPQDEIARGTSDPPKVRIPATALFADRAARFGTLAERSTGAGEYLGLFARVSAAQDQALREHGAPDLPDEVHMQRSRAHGLPPLGCDRPLDPRWRVALARIVASCAEGAPPGVAKALDQLRAATGERLDESAKSLLDLDYPALDAAEAPFIAAALQVHWTAMVRALGTEAIGPIDVPNVCPACGTPAVASVLAIDVPAPGTRYLHCALCACEWQLARGQCSFCEEREKVAFFHIEGGSEAIKAEACEACHSYLKVFNREKDAQADPVADDLATLSLDVLMDDAGYQRAGPNLFFVPGPA